MHGVTCTCHSVTIPLLSNIDLYGPGYISTEYFRPLVRLVYSGGGGGGGYMKNDVMHTVIYAAFCIAKTLSMACKQVNSYMHEIYLVRPFSTKIPP